MSEPEHLCMPCIFEGKRRSGPLASWCVKCGKHKSQHAAVPSGGSRGSTPASRGAAEPTRQSARKARPQVLEVEVAEARNTPPAESRDVFLAQLKRHLKAGGGPHGAQEKQLYEWMQDHCAALVQTVKEEDFMGIGRRFHVDESRLRDLVKNSSRTPSYRTEPRGRYLPNGDRRPIAF